MTVPLPDSTLHVEGLLAASFACDLIVITEYTDGEGAGAQVTRLSRDALRPVWTSKSVGFNVAEPLIDSPYVYLAAIGTVAKLDLRSGEYVWRHDGLYDRETGAFNIFAQPVRRGDTVFFTSDPAHRGGGRQIVVRDSSGSVVRP